jgi:hypothetical protein
VEQLVPIVIAALVLGGAGGFWVGRLNRRMAHRVDVPVVGLSTLDGHRPEHEGRVGVTVAVPKGVLRRTRIGDTVSVFLR